MVNRGYLRTGGSVMDVGTQNMLYATEKEAIKLVNRLREKPLDKAGEERIREVCYFSTPRAGERTAFMHELLEPTAIDYHSIDIVDGLKTTIFDLNRDTIPDEWRGKFEFVMNCGTLEHLVNQSNALEFIHECLAEKAIWFDQPPSVGFLNHGYYNFNPLFYLDWAAANNYELIETWYSHAGQYPATDRRFPVVAIDRLHHKSEMKKASTKPFSEDNPNPQPDSLESYNFNCVMRKRKHEPMRYPLEIRTTHGQLDAQKADEYGSFAFDANAKK